MAEALEDIIYHEDKLERPGGLHLFLRSWRPKRQARGVVVIVHGFNAHSGQYAWVACQFVADGLAVYAPDLRGRGLSDGERYYIEKMADWIGDVAAAVSLAKSREPGLPVFLLGHSAGGVVSYLYTLEHQSELDGFICESFAFQIPTPELAIAALKGLSHLAPHAHVVKLKNEDFSRDPEVVKMLNEDPLIANEVQPIRTAAELARADDRLAREFPLITLPILILHGTNDKVTNPAGSKIFFDCASSADKTIKFYAGYFHDPLHDIGKEAVVNDILNWADVHLLARFRVGVGL
jgi:acylglycerol lipase